MLKSGWFAKLAKTFMNILFLTRRFYPHIGGVEKHVYEVSKILLKKGYSVTIITEQSQNKLKLLETIEKIKIIRIPLKNTSTRVKKFVIWLFLMKNSSLIQQADIIHCHDVFIWYMPFRFLFPFKKIFTTFHGYEGKFPIKAKAIIIRRLSNFLSRGSINVGNFIEKWYGTKSTFTTYGGVDKNIIQNDPFDKLRIHPEDSSRGTSNSKLKIVFVGRLEEDTGIPIYLKALTILRKNNFHFTFTALGDGNYRKRVEKYGKVLGFNKNIENVMRQSDIVFASSYLSILESLAMKKKVIAVFADPLKEDYLKMSPLADYITIASTDQEIADGVRSMGHSGQDRKKIQNGYLYVKISSWEEVANLYIKLWKKNKKGISIH